MNSQKRRHWKAEEKLQIQAFRKSLSKKEGAEARGTDSTVSEVCRRYGIGTGQFYTWEKHARQGALGALRNGKRGRKESKQEDLCFGYRVALLKSELERLRAVIAELSMENLELKKGRWA
jgi:transposase-like protein